AESIAQSGKAVFCAAFEVHTQCAPATLGEHAEVAARLRRFDNAEADPLSGYWKIFGWLRGDLKKDTAVRAAFVSLAGGMQKARPEAETGRDAPPVAQRHAQLLQTGCVALIACDIGKECRVVAGAHAGEVRLEP